MIIVIIFTVNFILLFIFFCFFYIYLNVFMLFVDFNTGNSPAW